MGFKFRKNKRILYGVIFLILVSIEVLIALFVKDNFVRPYLGDVLVVWVIYSFVRIFFPERLKLLPLFVFLFAAIIEILQYFDFVHLLSLSDYKIAQIVLGSVFDIKDLFCYFVGCIFLAVYEWFRLKKLQKNCFFPENKVK